MKNNDLRTLSAFLAAAVLIPFAACGESSGTAAQETAADTDTAVTEA